MNKNVLISVVSVSIAVISLATTSALADQTSSSNQGGIPQQVQQLQAEVATLQQDVETQSTQMSAANNEIATQQNDISTLKQTVAEQQNEIQALQITNQQSAKEPTIAVTVTEGVYDDVWNGVTGTKLPNPIPPYVGAHVTVLSATGAKYSGITDEKGKVIFTVPEGIYVVNLESGTHNPWFYSLVETSVEHPATINW